MVFNSDQIAYMESLTRIPPEQKCWRCPPNDDLQGRATEDTEVSGHTLKEAKEAAVAAWRGAGWNLQAGWINKN